MTPAIAHRLPRPLSVLTALAALALSAPLALLGTPGHAAPMDDDSSNPGLKITSDIVIKSDDTYSVKAVMTDSSGFGIFSEDNCKVDDFSQTKFGKNSKNAKATFKEDGDSTICTIEGSASIKDSDGTIKHQGSEYVVKIGTDEAIGDMDQLDVTQSITFPGKVTEADGGKVDGTKVTFSDPQSHKVKGKDQGSDTARGTGGSRDTTGKSGSTPSWVWKLLAVLPLAVVGGVVGAVVSSQRRKKNQQAAPYTAPAQGYHPGQAFPPQPGQQGYQGPRGQQPYQPPYDGQPGQGY